MALSKILPASQEQYAGARNLIINGAMQVSQRGSSFTSSGYTTDRFKVQIENTENVAITSTQSTEAPDGFANSLRLQVTTAETTLNSDDLVYIFHCIEAQDCQRLKYGTSNAEKVTVSFWVRSSLTGTYSLLAYQEDDSRAATFDYSVNTADTWEYKTITISGDTTGVIDNDNGFGLGLYWTLAAGSDFEGSATETWGTYASAKFTHADQVNFIAQTGNFYITGVQLEVGEATPFEHRSYGDELRRCQRYYERSYLDSQYFMNGSSGAQVQRQTNYFQVQKRATPTRTQTADHVDSGASVGNVGANIDGITHSFGGSDNQRVAFSWTADAEL